MNHLTVNRVGPSRRATLYGREHIVVPMTMLVPGVLHGSRGPLYYSEKEMARNAADWNGMPILLGHPANGSGRTPDNINKFGVGHVFNARFINRRLTGEAWLDIGRLRSLAPNALSSIQTGAQVELSTGFNSSFDDTPGTYNGRNYAASVHGIRPDHLAVFVDGSRGACSVADGCGINNHCGCKHPLTCTCNPPAPLGLPAPMEFEPLRQPEQVRQQTQAARRGKPTPLGLPTMDFHDDVISKSKQRS